MRVYQIAFVYKNQPRIEMLFNNLFRLFIRLFKFEYKYFMINI